MKRLYKMFLPHLMCLLCAGLLVSGASAATTTVNPGATTLQDAITAASAGDVLELANGTFDGSISVDKQLTIRAATGANPVLHIQNTSAALLIEVKAPLTWQKINVIFDTPSSGSVGTCFMIQAAAGDVTIEDCSFTDGANGPNTGAWFFHSKANVIMNRVTMNAGSRENNQYLVGFIEYGNQVTLTATDCDFAMTATYAYFCQSLTAAAGNYNRMIFNNCKLRTGKQGGTAYTSNTFLMLVYYGELTLNDCELDFSNVTTNGILDSPASAATATKLVANRTVFNRGSLAAGVAMVGEGMANPNDAHEFTNCIFKGGSNAAGTNTPIRLRNAVNLTLKHCTFMDASPNANTLFVEFTGGTGARTASLEARNCLFDSGAVAPKAYIYDGSDAASPPDNSNVTYSIGKNLISIAPGTASADKTSAGTVVTGDPKLDANGMLTLGSAACGKGVDIGVTDDIKKEVRPNPAGSLPDVGADETTEVPVELSTFSAE